MHNLRNPSFFFTNNTSATQSSALGHINPGNTLGHIYPLLSKSCSYSFNSLISIGAIQYGG